MRPNSLLLPVLLLLAFAAYFIKPATLEAPSPPSVTHLPLPDPLTPQHRELFEALRPAVVRLQAVNLARHTGDLGTGFFISESGQVLTAYHVVSDGQLFRVSTLSGQSLAAQLVAFDAVHDLALLQVRARGPFPYLPLSQQPPLAGAPVLAIGNSGGDYLQPRLGRVLRLQAEASRADFPQGTLELNVPLAQGDSGGPVIDQSGQVLGVVSYVRVDEAGRTYTSYAVPVTERSSLMQQLRAGDKRDRPVIGVVIDNATIPLDTASPRAVSPNTEPLKQRSGVAIMRVAQGSPAAQAGLQGCQADRQGTIIDLGDIITAINEVPTPDANTYFRYMGTRQIGELVVIHFERQGQKRQVKVPLVARGSLPQLLSEESGRPCEW